MIERSEQLMSTITVENILRQIDQLPPVEQNRLERLLEQRRVKQSSQQSKTPRDKRLPDRPWPEAQAAMKWLREHAHEYRGQWVALAGDRLVAHGSDRETVRAAHKAAGLDASQVLLHRIPALDEPPFMGI
jgi:Family of unknown function (DUF5678)